MEYIEGIAAVRALARKALDASNMALKVTPRQPELYRNLWQDYLTLTAFADGAEAALRTCNNGRTPAEQCNAVRFLVPPHIDADLKAAAALQVIV